MVAIVKELLRRKYVEADVGISGANVIAADTGAVVIIENEGNARLATGLPPVHIVVAGIEKIVPTFQDAMKVAEVIWRYANYKMPSYVNIIAGPSKTGDIEKTITFGAHGPREFHLVLVDNGRSKAAKDPVLKEALYCLRCGACMYACPTWRVYGGFWGGDVYVGGIGVIWTAITRGIEEAYPHSLLCVYAGNCVEQCPLHINTPEMIREIRKRYFEMYKSKK